MAHIKSRSLGDGWPPAGAKNDPDPNVPTTAPTQSRVLLRQQFMPNIGLWVADFQAGVGNSDGFPAGTFYSMTSASMFTGVG